MKTPVRKSDFDELLLSRKVEERLERLREDGTLLSHFPEVYAMVGFGGGDTGHKDLWGHTKRVVAQCVPRPRVRWAALFHDVGKVKCFTRDEGVISFHGHEMVSAKLFNRAVDRLRFFGPSEAQAIHFLIYNLGYIEEYDPSWTDSAIRRLYKHAGAHFEDLMDLARADITTKHEDKRKAHHKRMHEFKARALELARIDAIPSALPSGLGEEISRVFLIPPSPELGKLMRALKASVEAGELPRQADIQAVVNFVRENAERFGVGKRP